MIREVASRTSTQAGDGTTTATVLAQTIVREGAKAVAAGMNPMDLKHGIDLAVDAVVKTVRARSKKISNLGRDRPGRHHLRQRRPRWCLVASLYGIRLATDRMSASSRKLFGQNTSICLAGLARAPSRGFILAQVRMAAHRDRALDPTPRGPR